MTSKILLPEHGLCLLWWQPFLAGPMLYGLTGVGQENVRVLFRMFRAASTNSYFAVHISSKNFTEKTYAGVADTIAGRSLVKYWERMLRIRVLLFMQSYLLDQGHPKVLLEILVFAKYQ